MIITAQEKRNGYTVITWS